MCPHCVRTLRNPHKWPPVRFAAGPHFRAAAFGLELSCTATAMAGIAAGIWISDSGDRRGTDSRSNMSSNEILFQRRNRIGPGRVGQSDSGITVDEAASVFEDLGLGRALRCRFLLGGCRAAAWNERQAKRMPMLFSPTIGCALKARHRFLWVRCPACCTTQSVDLRTVDRHPFAALTSLIPALSCRSCRPRRCDP
jgi:hypothetical protein